MHTLRATLIQTLVPARLVLIILACLIMVSFFVSADYAFAQAGPPPEPPALNPETENFGFDSSFQEVAIQSDRDLKSIIATIINITLGFLGIIAVIFIIYAGYIWMTAGGNQEQVSKAKLIIRNAVIGLVVILSSWAIAAFVISRLSSATGGGGGDGPPGGGVLPDPDPELQFVLENFQTKHDGVGSHEDVYVCSSVQARFNHWLAQSTVIDALDDETLLVLQTKENVEDDGTGGTVLPEPKVTSLKSIRALSNTIVFELDYLEDDDTAIDEWPIFSEFEIRVPSTVTDHRARPLVACDADGACDPVEDENGKYFPWRFYTTDKKETIAPILTSAYPQISGAEDYPDTNVDRVTQFTIEFDEPIFAPTVIEDNHLVGANIKIQRIVSSDDQTVISTIPEDNFDATLTSNDTGVVFALNENHTAEDGELQALESFSWYLVTIQNVADLCGNVMAAPVQWIFRTNDNLPGIASLYPPNGYENSCPTTRVAIQFRTSMYNIQESNCEVDPANGGHVLSGENVGDRALKVQDPPGQGDSPNEHCKLYAFEPVPESENDADALQANQTYGPEVEYRDISSGETRKTNGAHEDDTPWSFDVKPANKCVDPPHITRVQKSKGKWGQCVTISGWGFGETKQSNNAITKLTTDSDRSLRNHTVEDAGSRRSVPLAPVIMSHWEGDNAKNITTNAWEDTSIAADIYNLSKDPGTNYMPAHESYDPDAGGAWIGREEDIDIDVMVQIAQEVGGETKELVSNPYKFYVNSADEYAGPCLYSISPNKGYWGDDVTLNGRNLGLKNDDDKVAFYQGKHTDISSIPTSERGDTHIATIVPDQAQENSAKGEVYVKIAEIESNKLEFDISGGTGESCTITRLQCSDSHDLCRQGLECAVGGDHPCTCQRVVRFEIEKPTPRSGCTDSCSSAQISFQTSKNILETSITDANIELRKCVDDTCDWQSAAPPIDTSSALYEDEDGVTSEQWVIITPNTTGNKLDLDSWYIVRILGGTNGLLATDNKQIHNLNNDTDDDTINDAYTWQFKTGKNECAVARIELDHTRLSLYETDTADVTAKAYGPGNSCSKSGQLMTPSDKFEWKACAYTAGDITAECTTACVEPELAPATPVITVSTSSTSQTSLTGVNGSHDNTAKGLVCGFYDGGTIKDGAIVTVRTPCVSDAQCKQDGLCEESICIRSGDNKGKCTPVINDFNPKDGDIGTWVTINGCYFGNERGHVAIAEHQGVPVPTGIPDIEWCSNTWTDTQIIAARGEIVSANGPVIVRRTDSELGTSTGIFSPDSVVHPGICKAIPDRGRKNTIVDIHGQNLGDIDPASVVIADYKVTFFTDVEYQTLQVVTTNERTSCPDDGWADDQVCIRVADATAGEGTVKVVNNTQPSNTLEFEVLDASSGSANSKNMYVTAYTPGVGGLACPLMIVEVYLDGQLDIGSVGVEFNTVLDAGELANSQFVVKDAEDTILAGELRVETSSSYSVLIFDPLEVFKYSDPYTIVLGSELETLSGGVLASRAGDACEGMVNGTCSIPFNTVNTAQVAQCVVDHLNIKPNAPVFTCAERDDCDSDDNKNTDAPGHQKVFTSEAVAKNGQTITAPSGVMGYWSFNNDAINGTAVLDQSRNGYDLEINPSPGATPTQGISGNALEFDGVADEIQGDISGGHVFASEATISAWFKAPSPGADQPRIVEFSEGGDQKQSSALRLSTNGTLRVWVSCADNSGDTSEENKRGRFSTSETYFDDQWHHAVYAYNGSEGSLYVDGVHIHTEAGTCENIFDAKKVSIGNYTASTPHSFKGLIDEVRIYDRALSEPEILILYAIPGPSYTWQTSDQSILSFESGLPEPDKDKDEIFTIQAKNGSTLISSRIDGTSITGSTEARVFLCENPWPYEMRNDSDPFNDSNSSALRQDTVKDIKTNFSTFYCKDRGEFGEHDDLPEIGATCNGGDRAGLVCSVNEDCPGSDSCVSGIVEFGLDDTGRSDKRLLKEIFLTQARSRECIDGDAKKIGASCVINENCGVGGQCVGEIDAIGIRSLKNEQNYTINNWYASQSELKGNPQSISPIDSFSAIQDGRTIYVNALNDTLEEDDPTTEDEIERSIYNNIYLISVNDGAHPDTINIFNQLVSNWRFLVNINPDQKQKLKNDVVRIQDAISLANLLDSKEAPELLSGSFEPGWSLSVWPSWNSALSQDFGTSLPHDPVENISCSTEVDGAGNPIVADSQTCWVPGIGYSCDTSTQTHIYIYEKNDTNASFLMNLEYKNADRWNWLTRARWDKIPVVEFACMSHALRYTKQ